MEIKGRGVEMLFKWFLGRMLKKDVLQDIRAAKMEMTLAERMVIARKILEELNFINHYEIETGHKRYFLIEKLSERYLQAKKDIHAALGMGANTFSDPSWCTASIIEAYILSRLNALQHRLSFRDFDKIDSIVFEFIVDTLGPEEVGSEIIKCGDSSLN